MAAMMDLERTYIMIKPDGVQRGLIGDIVKRFDGKVMAITGYEIDQVVHPGPQPNTSTTGPDRLGGFACWPASDCGGDADASVPIYHAYNHHYFSWITSDDAVVAPLDAPTAWCPLRTGEGSAVLPHCTQRSLDEVFAFDDFLAVTGREGGFTAVWLVALAAARWRRQVVRPARQVVQDQNEQEGEAARHLHRCVGAPRRAAQALIRLLPLFFLFRPLRLSR